MAAALSMQSNGGSALHPFFSKPSGPHTGSEHPAEASSTSGFGKTAAEDQNSSENIDATDLSRKNSSKRKKPRQKAQDVGSSQKTLAQVLNPAATVDSRKDADAQSVLTSLPSAPGSDNGKRRKRRRTSEIESRDVGDDEEVVVGSEDGSGNVDGHQMDVDRQTSPLVVIPPAKQNLEVPLPRATADEGAISMTPPKKMLKLSAGGKLASPVAKKATQDDTPSETKRRGRPRKAKEQQPTKVLDVCIRYGDAYEVEKRTLLGLRLDRILVGEERLSRTQTTPRKPRTPKKSKVTHPFFTGKPKEPVLPKIESPRKMTATTPGKLKSQAMHDRTVEPFEDVSRNFSSALLKDRLMTRHPGAREAAWPDGENFHVRALTEEPLPDRLPHMERRLKQKQTRLGFESEESIIHKFANTLQPEAEPELRPDGYHQPRRDLRLPKKLVLSGAEIASQVEPTLQASSLSNLDTPRPASQITAHPALARLWQGLPKHISAFDRCAGDTQGWTQKFAPSTALEVLQPSHTMTVLTDWLKALIVNTVSSGPNTNLPLKEKASKPKKKRRRKVDDMDDFLVPSDEEILDVQDLPSPASEMPGDSRLPRSTVQMANGDAKRSNAVLLSGSHGCGKTAAAYAVAKELGYQVFEISSAERRSGRDVLDRVGDMTENHIVKHHGVDPGELSASEDRSRMEAAFQKDLDSGRQGKMASFFKAKPAAKKLAAKPKAVKISTLETLQKALTKPSKDQQQSLILLEEVDVLFKEDKEFWNTVLKLVATSKRPFIMTCNDEDLVPLQAMSLHAILRLGPPPTDLAVDYLLLIAATEGHLLQRQAVSSLYESRGSDLRASITELDFWCQMGVGDPKGGLDWILQRYPAGSDVDQQGRTLRVVSDGSFQTGMGFTDPALTSLEETLSFIWHEYGIEPTKVLDPRCGPSSVGIVPSHATDLSLSSLDQIGKLADSLSAMDVYTTHSTMDTSLPELSERSRSHYIEGMALLESNERANYSETSEKIAVAAALSAHRVFSASSIDIGALSTTDLLSSVYCERQAQNMKLSRRMFTCFDPITCPTSNSPATGLEYSALDGPIDTLATEIAPFIRSIVQYDVSLEEQRAQLSGFAEGKNVKRARTTRAARSAMEGSQRASTRRERWFVRELDMQGVLATGGKEWPKTIARTSEGEASQEENAAPASSAEESIIYE